MTKVRINTWLLSCVIAGLAACSEPFVFDVESTSIDVIDAKVSTLIDRSFVRIYTQSENIELVDITDVEVSIVSRSGLESNFVYDEASKQYLPELSGFVGMVGEAYRLEVSRADELIYWSEYDSIVQTFDFSVSVKDTVETVLSELNQIREIDGVAAVAEIPAQSTEVYSRLSFSYAYFDILITGDREIFSEGEFVLFACTNSTSCSENIQVPVGIRRNQPWYFYNDNNPECTGAPQLTGEFCEPPCCRSEISWTARFRVYQEALTKSAYEYWENVVRLRSNDGLIFDSYPFPIEGNINCTACENEAVGFFRTVDEKFEEIEVII